MRMISLRLPQTRSYPIFSSGLRRHGCSVIQKHGRSLFRPRGVIARHTANSSSPQHVAHNDTARSFGSPTHGASAEKDQLDHDVKEQAYGTAPQPSPVISPSPYDLPRRHRRDPNVWADWLERALPPELSAKEGAKQDYTDGALDPAELDSLARKILRIISDAHNPTNARIDILAHMLSGSKLQVALRICNILLENVVRGTSFVPSDTLPSNIAWPEQPLWWTTLRGIHVDTTSRPVFEPCEQWERPAADPRYSSSNIKSLTMNRVWATLGNVVVQATRLTEEKAQQPMQAVKLILGQIHKLNLIPDNVYAYQLSPHPATVQRSPLIHLVSSRILMALSDATWRHEQQVNIERATSRGLSLAEIGRDPPGGRFRLTVGAIPPEVWLEFILWCCVEGGFAPTGLNLVNSLQQDAEDPWSAVTWSQSDHSGQPTPQFSWEPAKRGVSKVKQLAEVPHRTISTEVVLALVEGQIDCVRRVPDARGARLAAVQDGIEKLLAFLEPHDLPWSYFDYVSARLMQTETFDAERSKMMAKWVERLMFLRSLKTARKAPPTKMSFQLDSLSIHSEFTPALIHQALESCVQESNIDDALRLFDDLQRSVDDSKLQAITSFLQNLDLSSQHFSSSPFLAGNPDFVGSHGQLPLYKLGSLLNLATDMNLQGFGQWLLRNDDPDGPLIPRHAYGKSGISRALVRFAGLCKDRELLQLIPTSLRSTRRSTANMLRATFDARVSLLELEDAYEILERLSQPQGGGYNLNNLTHLAATILRLEHNTLMPDAQKNLLLDRATHLLDAMLTGRYAGKHGGWHTRYRTRFYQRVVRLLSVFETVQHSCIVELARKHIKRYQVGNISNLPPRFFNTFLEAVVEVRGAAYGVAFVERCCTSVEEDADADARDDLGDDDDDLDADVDASRNTMSMMPTEDSSHAYIPFVQNPDVNDDSLASRVGTSTEVSSNDLNETSLESRNTEPDSVEIRPNEAAFYSPFFNRDDEPLDVQDDGMVDMARFDARTIRIVVRKAIQERDHMRRNRRSSLDHVGVLEWARSKFLGLGYSESLAAHLTRTQVREGNGKLPDTAETTTMRRHRQQLQARGVSRVTRSFTGKLVMGEEDDEDDFDGDVD